MGRNIRRLVILLAALSSLTLSAWAQRQQEQGDTYLDPSIPEGVTVRDIIGKFAAQEQVFKQAREHYTYRQSVRMQTLTDNGFPDGEYDDTFDVVVNDQGQR
jgi:hypothetical protein